MTQPNIVVVLADDLGWGDLGCYGASAIPTPAIDSLAARGFRFDDCHAVSAVCTPSRYGLLTGTYPWRSPLRSGVLGGADPAILQPGMATLASSLKAAGYATGAFGKWHLGLDWLHRDGTRPSAHGPAWRADMQNDGRTIDYTAPFTSGPLDHGFDRFFGIAGSLDMPPYAFLNQDRTLGVPSIEKHPLVTSQRPGLAVAGWRDDEVDLRFLAEATSWIREQSGPFFAYIATAAPHRPCVPPEVVKGTSKAGPRGDGVCLVDHMVGSLMQVIEELGLSDNTWVVLASDNGAPTRFPEDGDVVHHHPNGPWRGQKADAWEGGHRVPLICAGPGVTPAVVTDATVSLLDLFPTLADAVNTPAPDGLDGRSFYDLLTGIPNRDGDRRIIAATAFDGSLALRHGNRKAIFTNGSGGFSDPIGTPVDPASADGQLYDLDVDPAEQHNLWPASGDEPSRMFGLYKAVTGYPGR